MPQHIYYIKRRHSPTKLKYIILLSDSFHWDHMVVINVGLASQKIYCSYSSSQKEYYHFTYYSMEAVIYCTLPIFFVIHHKLASASSPTPKNEDKSASSHLFPCKQSENKNEMYCNCVEIQ